jgi:ubiquinone/menaquinone biosynthesis C-methylase UbiE
MPIPDTQLKEAIARRWDDSSATYDGHTGHGVKSDEEHDAWKAIFNKVLPAGNIGVLDVGCGTGELSMLLAGMGYRVTGLDLSDKMLEIAKAKAAARGLDIRYGKGDAENLPYDPETFDAVFNRHVLWTLPNPGKALESWKRVLRDGGRAMIIDGVWDDHTLSSKARRLTSNVCKMAIERENPWKNYYSKELESSLPNMGGTPLEKAKGYLEAAGFRDIGHIDLLHIRDIQKKSMPFRDRIRHNYEYYLVFGDK